MSRPRVSARPLTEGALFAALAVVLSLIGFYVPVMGLFVVFLWPVPIAMIAVRHGMRMAVLTVVTAGLVLSTFIGVFEAAMTTIGLGLLGLAFGFALRRGYSATRTLIVATVAAFMGAAVAFIGGLLVTKINIFTQMMEELALAASQTTQIYEGMATKFGVPKETIEPVLQAFSPQAIDMMKLILPGTFVLGEFVTAYLNYEVFRRIMPRFGVKVPAFPPFEEWRFPRGLSVLYVASQGLMMLKAQESITVLGSTIQIAPHGETLYRIGANIASPLMLCMLVQGLALAFYFVINKLKWDRKLAKVALAFVFINPLLAQLALMFGLVDNLFDYRALMNMKLK